jgi:hypothetical protein
MRSNRHSLAPGTAVIALFAALLLCVLDAACGYDENYSHMSAGAYVKALQKSRSHMYDASTNFDEAFTFGTLVHELILRGKAGAVPDLDKDQLVDESIGYLDETAVKTKKADNLSALYVLKYEILLDSGDNRAAVKALKAALEAYPGGPALRPLLQILIKTGHKANVPVWCKYERSRLVSNDDLYLLCVICAQHGDRLEWLSTADRRTLGYRVSVSNRKKDTADTAADTAGAKH